MVQSAFDHLVVVAPSRDAGDAWVADRLGVTPVEGGAHPAMATHNALLRLGNREYLEVIAVDPSAPRPERPRWFELDRPGAADRPRLAAWVARTSDVQAAAARSPLSLGSIEAMTRGSLTWSITVSTHGGLVLDGTAPMLIEWPVDVHPAEHLPDSGCSLEGLRIHHQRVDRLEAFFAAIGFDGPVTLVRSREGERPRLVAVIRTCGGVRVLGED